MNTPHPGHEWRIRPAVSSDNDALLELEAGSPMPGSRPMFQVTDFFGRPDLFDRSAILVAEMQGRLIGVICGAAKTVTLRGQQVRLGYHFNARVGPDRRLKGVGRSLAVALREWDRQQGVDVMMILVGEANIPSLRFATEEGYTRVATLRQLSIRKPEVRYPVDLFGDAEFFDVKRSSEWRGRVTDPYRGRDFYPVNAIDELYTLRPDGGGYRGTLVVSGASTSWASLWDKDTAMRRKPLRDEDRALYMFDMHPQGPEVLPRLVSETFLRFPEIGRVVLVGDSALAAEHQFGNAIAYSFAIMVRLPADCSVPVTPYIDVRDAP